MEGKNYHKQILNALKQAEFGLTQRELSEEVQISRTSVRKYGRELLDRGDIAVIEKAGSYIYHIPEEEGGEDYE